MKSKNKKIVYMMISVSLLITGLGLIFNQSIKQKILKDASERVVMVSKDVINQNK